MTSEEAAWVAGILEGEGCFDGNAGKACYPRIRVQMTDLDVIERLQSLTGGRITYPKNKRAHWKQTALLVINGRSLVEPVLRAVRPWMGARRGAKIDALLAVYE